VDKYREGKLQRTLKRELKEPEIGNVEGFGTAGLVYYPLSGLTLRKRLNSYLIVGRFRTCRPWRSHFYTSYRIGYRRPERGVVEGGFEQAIVWRSKPYIFQAVVTGW
jgi:hypothetical protein